MITTLHYTLHYIISHTSRSQKIFHISSANTNYLQNGPLRRIMLLANEDNSFDVSLF